MTSLDGTCGEDGCVPLLLHRPSRCGWWEVFCGGGETAVTYQRLSVTPQLSFGDPVRLIRMLVDSDDATMAEKILLGHMTNKFDTLKYPPQLLKCSKQDSLTYLLSTYYHGTKHSTMYKYRGRPT